MNLTTRSEKNSPADRRTRALLFGIGLAAALVLIGRTVPPYWTGKDLREDYVTALALRDGLSILTPLDDLVARYLPEEAPGFPHPNPHLPALSLMMLPLTVLPYRWLVIGWLGLNLALLWWIGRRLGLSWQARMALAAWPPVFSLLWIGQWEVVILALLMLGWIRARQQKEVQAGAFLGLAVALKLYPALILLPFIARRRWRGVLAAGATVGALVGLSAAILGTGEFWRWATVVVPDVSGRYSTVYQNASLYGSGLRLFGGADTDPVLAYAPLIWVLPLLGGFAGLLILVRLKPEFAPLGILLILPSSWFYHAALLLPIVVGMLQARPRRYLALAALVAVSIEMPQVTWALVPVLRLTNWPGGHFPWYAGVLLSVQSLGYLGLAGASFTQRTPGTRLSS